MTYVTFWKTILRGMAMVRKAVGKVERAFLQKYGVDASALQGVCLLAYEKGEYLSREGMPFAKIYIVLHGKAKVFCDVENGRRLLISFYEEGGMIGDLELMTDMEVASASVQALTEGACIAIPLQKENRTYLRENVAFLNIVGKSLANKLERSSKNGAHIILYPLEERLCSYIDVTVENDLFEERLTEVAEVIGTSYRHLLRELNRLVENGILEKCGKHYRIKDRAALKQKSRDFYHPLERDLVGG